MGARTTADGNECGGRKVESPSRRFAQFRRPQLLNHPVGALVGFFGDNADARREVGVRARSASCANLNVRSFSWSACSLMPIAQAQPMSCDSHYSITPS